jgi:ribosomal protein S18 acetylase RimI-like enzyme
VLVVHTLCVPPSKTGRGYAKQLLAFAKELALEMGCKVIRMDTHVANVPAQGLYKKMGYSICGSGEVLLNGQIPQMFYFLEMQL